ncbi:MAG: GNAT family N-acetyltransferase [Actinobacteria bacterium]|nr:GNAT family N-acetyltransferase [Actinomycetota bacterium]
MRQYGLRPDDGTWAISCLLVAPAQRGRGVARAVLRAVLEDLRALGVRRVEAFPRLGTDDPWTGPESLFRTAGFELAQDDAERPVLALRLGFPS